MIKPTLIFLLFLKILFSNKPSSTISVSTYSIVSYDPKTGHYVGKNYLIQANMMEENRYGVQSLILKEIPQKT